MDNAAQALPESFLTLGEEKYKLVPSFSVFVRFEKASGKNGLDPLMWVSPSATDLVTLVWAAIGGEKSGKTIDQVADLMTGAHLEDVRMLVREMFKKTELPESIKNDVAAE
jgi:hypothetical protein